MNSLLSLVTCARLSGPWTRSRIAGLKSTSSRVIHSLALAFEPCRLPAPVPLPVRVPRLGAFVVLPALMLALLAATPSFAARGIGFESSSDGRLVDVQVQVDGRNAPLYFPRDGSDRRYFEAMRGRHYALAITNKTGRRIGVLVAVDGLNVVNGQRSSLGSNEAMYVLDPYGQTVIRGWRTSLNDVRQFVFVDEERSYAERTDQANGDMGWVRVLAFNEREQWFNGSPGRIKDGERPRDEVYPNDGLEGQGGAARQLDKREQAAPESESSRLDAKGYNQAPAPQSAVPGTGWGEKSWDPVRRVWFVPESYATDQLVLRYEYASGLRALGIFPLNIKNRLWEREHGELGFAQPPRW
jgi:hypothetical protein